MMFSQKAIRGNYKRCLNRALTMGAFAGSDMGYDQQTEDAINAVARAYPNPDPKLVEQANIELESFLSGKRFSEMVNSRKRESLGPVPLAPRRKSASRHAR